MHDIGSQIDTAQSFQLESQAIRGRMITLFGSALTDILDRQAYPRAINNLVGEALLLAGLSAQSLKFEGRFLVQAEGKGPISTLVAEVSSGGQMRAYAKQNPTLWPELEAISLNRRITPAEAFGQEGRLSLIILQAERHAQPYQGVVAMSGASLADCAEEYFLQSEQIPSVLRLAVAEYSGSDQKAKWVGRGILLQKIASDDARGDTEDDWNTAMALMSTLSPAELADPALSSEALLFQLFHERGVRVEPASILQDACVCSREKLTRTLTNLGSNALTDLFQTDPSISITCEFCGRKYTIKRGAVNL